MVVDRVYETSPYIRVCSLVDSKDRRIRTLMPDVPTLSLKEHAPASSTIEREIVGPYPKTRVLKYEVVGEAGPHLALILQPQELKVFRHLWLTGKRSFSPEEVRNALSSLKLSGKVTAERAFLFYSKHYASLGLIREIREQRSSVSRRLREIVGV